MNKENAYQMALEVLKSQSNNPDEWEFIEEKTKERNFGWVFFYDSKQFLKTGNIIYASSGGPILVDKETGFATQLGSRLSADDYIKLYEKYRHDLPAFSNACMAYCHGDPI